MRRTHRGGGREPKLAQIVQADLFDTAALGNRLAGYDACFFCLGVSSAGLKEPRYRLLTYDLTLALATALAELNPEMAFLYVSAGTCPGSRDERPASGVGNPEPCRWHPRQLPTSASRSSQSAPSMAAMDSSPARSAPTRSVVAISRAISTDATSCSTVSSA